MTDFETETALSLVVEERELRQARQAIEDGIGDVEVGVAGQAGAGGGRPPEMASGGGGEVAARDRARQRQLLDSQVTEMETAVDVLRTLTELAEARNDHLNTIENTDILDTDFTRKVPGLGGEDEDGDADVAPDAESDSGRPPEMQADGGSSRQQRRNRREHRWDRSRTNDIEDILELLERTDFGGEGGGGLAGGLMDLGGDLGGALAGALPAGIGAAVGSAAGPVIAEELSDAGDDIVDLEDAPDWVPIEVEDPTGGDYDFEAIPEDEEDSSDRDALDFLPDPGDLPTLPIPEIETVSVHDPSPLTVDDPSPLGVDAPELAVDDPSPLGVDTPEEIPVEDVGPIEVMVDFAGGGGDSTSGDGEVETTPVFEHIGLPELDEFSARTADAGGDLSSDLADRFGIGGGGGSSGGSASSGSRVPTEVNVDHSPTYRVDVDPRRLDDLADRIVSAIEDGVERDLRDIEEDLRELRSDFEEFERGITR